MRTAATNRQSRVDSIKNAIAIVRGVVAIIGGAIGIVFGIKQLDERVLSDLPSKPRHFFQLRKEKLRELEEKFCTLEEGNVAKTVYITGNPATGKTQLASEYGRKFFESNKYKNRKLFVGRLNTDSYSNCLQSYLQVAHDLGCVKEETEKAIRSGIGEFKDELASVTMLSWHVKKALRKRPGWLLIIDGWA